MHLLQAYVWGSWVAILGTIQGYMQGIEVVSQRFAAQGFNPSDLGFYLDLAIPIAAYVGFRAPTLAIKIPYLACIPAALMAILLTASRAAVVGGAVGLLFVLYSLQTARWKWRLATTVLLVAATVLLLNWVPQTNLARIATIVPEIRGGTLNERLTIWAAGFHAFGSHPLWGVGAGAFRLAVEPILGMGKAPHNVFLATAVEEGIVGLILWLLFVGMAFASVPRLPRHERWLWVVIFCVLTVAFLTGNPEWRKATWLMLAFASACSRPGMRKFDAVGEGSS
ncbi:MAG: O-antigen ligase family protein [Candidatus Acetothermia bacterium]|jgi:O-antigen ligase|nr:O-antigen ligase family protein [Candidatus Acetothermia bacterium]